jgi:hypothetical protein
MKLAKRRLVVSAGPQAAVPRDVVVALGDGNADRGAPGG